MTEWANDYVNRELLHFQRAVRPIYKQTVTGYLFSSTATLVLCKNYYFMMLANHAVEQSISQKTPLVFLNSRTGYFSILPLYEMEHFKDIDISILCIDANNYQLSYHNLNYPASDLCDHCIGWIGFPSKYANEFHATKVPNETLKQFSYHDGRILSHSAKYRMIIGPRVYESESIGDGQIGFQWDGKNVTFEKTGYFMQSFSLQGMSGGALLYLPINPDTGAVSLEEASLAGIGLEWKQKKIAWGISREALIDALDEYFARKRKSAGI